MPEPRHSVVRDVRRAQIVDAARKIVGERGLAALTFAALEQELGFSRGVVTWHFRNKDEVERAVLEAAIADIDREVLAAVKAQATFAERARAVVREMVHGWLGAAGAGAVLVAFWSRLDDPEVAELNADLWARYRAYSADLVRMGQARGEFRSDADPDAVGAWLVGLVIGIGLQAKFDPKVDLERVIASAGEAVVRALTVPGTGTGTGTGTAPDRAP